MWRRLGGLFRERSSRLEPSALEGKTKQKESRLMQESTVVQSASEASSTLANFQPHPRGSCPWENSRVSRKELALSQQCSQPLAGCQLHGGRATQAGSIGRKQLRGKRMYSAGRLIETSVGFQRFPNAMRV